MTSLLQTAPRRNITHHIQTVGPVATDLTAGGKVVFLRIRRPPPTCNAIAELAGFGREAR